MKIDNFLTPPPKKNLAYKPNEENFLKNFITQEKGNITR